MHVRCAAHVLNIMVQAGLKVIPNAIGSVRDIIKVVTSSPSHMQIFNSIVQSLGFRSLEWFLMFHIIGMQHMKC